MKKLIAMILTASMVLGLTACAAAPAAAPAPAETKEEAAEPAEEPAAEEETEVEEPAAEAPSAEEETEAEETAAEESAAGEEDVVRPAEIQVFIAASLSTVMDVIAQNFNEKYPDIKVVYNADSSGKLLTQIEEGYACDVVFSAAQKQMNTLEQDDGLVVEGTRHNVVNNQVVVVTLKDSGTAVTGLADIGKAESIALADGSVPVGRYSRVAMMNLGLLPETEDASAYTTQEVSDALGGIEINECANVGAVAAAVYFISGIAGLPSAFTDWSVSLSILLFLIMMFTAAVFHIRNLLPRRFDYHLLHLVLVLLHCSEKKVQALTIQSMLCLHLQFLYSL